MVKKKKSSAQDLIDSLLDDSSDESTLAIKNDESQPDDATQPLHVVKTATKKAVDAQVKSQREESIVSPSEIHRAATIVVKDSRAHTATTSEPTSREPVTRSAAAKQSNTSTDIRFGIGKMAAAKPSAGGIGSGAVLTSAEASLKQSESLRIAQKRIHELEIELERLRRSNEKLASAGETLRKQSDELSAKLENLQSQSREQKQIYDEEKKLWREQTAARDKESAELKSKLDEAQNRLEANFKRIRVRERELEHRLEIVKMESTTLISSKDELIMRLKREIDQLKFETENSKQRSQELYGQFKEKQETIVRVVRALRIALTILEGDEKEPLKKVD